jgi:hypothetical protein
MNGQRRFDLSCKNADEDRTKHKELIMASDEKVKGPASYFPSIEKKYGKPIDYWMEVLKDAGPLSHMELVTHLKTQHAMGHGHANALVAWFMAKK